MQEIEHVQKALDGRSGKASSYLANEGNQIERPRTNSLSTALDCFPIILKNDL